MRTPSVAALLSASIDWTPLSSASRLTRAGVLALAVGALGCAEDMDSPTEPTTATPQAALSATATLTLLQVSAGPAYFPHTCGVTSDNRVYCWGSNHSGQLGVGTSTGPQLCALVEDPQSQTWACSTRPQLVRGGYSFRQVSAGDAHTCGVTTDDRVYCWGSNANGQLGDGSTMSRPQPVLVAGGLRFRQVEAGSYHTCARTTDNRAYCWGWNSSGQLGDGSTTLRRLRPVAVAGTLSFRQLSAGWRHTCGVTTTYRAYCWGSKRDGVLGANTSDGQNRVTPVPVAGGHEFRQVDAGENHTCAVTTASAAFCWGEGNYGQRGNGERSSGYWPKAVAGGLLFSRVTAGSTHTCGETTTNQAYCWGYNGSGELGDGTADSQPAPIAVAGGLAFGQVSAGHWYTCGKTAAGVGYCWGRNTAGSLGDGTTTSRLLPTPVAGPM